MIRKTTLATFVLILGFAAAAPAQYKGAEPVPAQLKKGFDSITAESCRGWLSQLASDEFEGRGSGTPGYMKAAEFMAARFKEFGLEPKGDKGTWFQGVPFNSSRAVDADSYVEVAGSGARLACGKDVAFSPAKADKKGDVVFVFAKGKKARLPDAKALRGKVIIVRGLEEGNWRLWSQLSSRTAAMLKVVDDVSASQWKSSRSRRGSRRIIGEITEAAATKLAAAVGVKPSEVLADLEDDQAVIVNGGESQAHLVVKMETRPAPVPNVVGFLEGSDPSLRHEVVIMGSHLDHLGKRGETIYNGADDDGSGSTALLAVAQAFAKSSHRPRRSLLFLAFCGEEMGLIGSRYYADNPIFPIKDSVCELQMDMVGRNEEKKGESPEENVRTTHLVGSKRLSTELHELVIEKNRHVGFEFEYDEEDVYTRSDHYSFARKGIPVAFLFSGFHPDYHKATDTVEKINFEKIANTAKLIYLTAYEAADKEKRLRVDKKKKKSKKK